MGYRFTIKGGMRVKRDGVYPWPCADLPDRTIELFAEDVLTIDPKTGLVMKHTGLGCFGIRVPLQDMEPWGEDKHLQLI